MESKKQTVVCIEIDHVLSPVIYWVLDANGLLEDYQLWLQLLA